MLQDMKPCMFWLEGLERRKHHLPVPTNQTIENTTTNKKLLNSIHFSLGVGTSFCLLNWESTYSFQCQLNYWICFGIKNNLEFTSLCNGVKLKSCLQYNLTRLVTKHAGLVEYIWYLDFFHSVCYTVVFYLLSY